MRSMGGRKLQLAIGALLASLLLAVSATAAEGELTRAEYAERVEPICKTNVLANKRIFKGAKEEVKAGKLKLASNHFFRAATAFGKTIDQIAAVPQPPADTAKLGKWLSALRKEKAIIEKIGRALKAEDKRKAESYSVELNRNTNQANNAALGFSFDYCRLDSARFG